MSNPECATTLWNSPFPLFAGDARWRRADLPPAEPEPYKVTRVGSPEKEEIWKL